MSHSHRAFPKRIFLSSDQSHNNQSPHSTDSTKTFTFELPDAISSPGDTADLEWSCKSIGLNPDFKNCPTMELIVNVRASLNANLTPTLYSIGANQELPLGVDPLNEVFPSTIIHDGDDTSAPTPNSAWPPTVQEFAQRCSVAVLTPFISATHLILSQNTSINTDLGFFFGSTTDNSVENDLKEWAKTISHGTSYDAEVKAVTQLAIAINATTSMWDLWKIYDAHFDSPFLLYYEYLIYRHVMEHVFNYGYWVGGGVAQAENIPMGLYRARKRIEAIKDALYQPQAAVYTDLTPEQLAEYIEREELVKFLSSTFPAPGGSNPILTEEPPFLMTGMGTGELYAIWQCEILRLFNTALVSVNLPEGNFTSRANFLEQLLNMCPILKDCCKLETSLNPDAHQGQIEVVAVNTSVPLEDSIFSTFADQTQKLVKFSSLMFLILTMDQWLFPISDGSIDIIGDDWRNRLRRFESEATPGMDLDSHRIFTDMFSYFLPMRASVEPIIQKIFLSATEIKSIDIFTRHYSDSLIFDRLIGRKDFEQTSAPPESPAAALSAFYRRGDPLALGGRYFRLYDATQPDQPFAIVFEDFDTLQFCMAYNSPASSLRTLLPQPTGFKTENNFSGRMQFSLFPHMHYGFFHALEKIRTDYPNLKVIKTIPVIQEMDEMNAIFENGVVEYMRFISYNNSDNLLTLKPVRIATRMISIRNKYIGPEWIDFSVDTFYSSALQAVDGKHSSMPRSISNRLYLGSSSRIFVQQTDPTYCPVSFNQLTIKNILVTLSEPSKTAEFMHPQFCIELEVRIAEADPPEDVAGDFYEGDPLQDYPMREKSRKSKKRSRR